MSLRQWWTSMRASKFGDVPFILLGVFIGWNCDISCAVKGVSMLPTLRPGEYIVFVPYSLLKLRQWLGVPLVKPDDVVVVKVSEDLSVCKRVTKSTTVKAEAEAWGAEHYVEVVPPPYFAYEDGELDDDYTSTGDGQQTSETQAAPSSSSPAVDVSDRDAAAERVVASEQAYYDYVTRNAVRARDWDACTDRIANPSRWIWLEGDNKSDSLDSRRCGPVPVECVRGLVLGSVWPTPHLLKGPPPAA